MRFNPFNNVSKRTFYGVEVEGRLADFIDNSGNKHRLFFPVENTVLDQLLISRGLNVNGLPLTAKIAVLYGLSADSFK